MVGERGEARPDLDGGADEQGAGGARVAGAAHRVGGLPVVGEDAEHPRAEPFGVEQLLEVGRAAPVLVRRHDRDPHRHAVGRPEAELVGHPLEPLPQVRRALDRGRDDEQHGVGGEQHGRDRGPGDHPAAVGEDVVVGGAEHRGELAPRGTEARHLGRRGDAGEHPDPSPISWRWSARSASAAPRRTAAPRDSRPRSVSTGSSVTVRYRQVKSPPAGSRSATTGSVGQVPASAMVAMLTPGDPLAEASA